MTLIERALLPERPAFFVTAGQRGGGKTTLVNMITLAVLGRRAAAAGWSDNGRGAEEGAVLLSAPGRGVSRLGQHRPRIGDQLPAHRGGAHGSGDIGSRAGRFPRGDGAVDHRADLHRQFDYAARRYGEPVADAGAERKPPGPRESGLSRIADPLAWTQRQPAEDRARALHAADRWRIRTVPNSRRPRPGSKPGGASSDGRWNTRPA